jgi:competence protein ComEC
VALAAFATGATLLQFCARLPPVPGVLAGITLALMVAALFVGTRAAGSTAFAPWPAPHAQGRSIRLDRMLPAIVAVAVTGIFGFCYAAWRADVRLGDALPPAWEETDVRITGIVDDLPQNTIVGARFAFAVESVLTTSAVVPQRVSLAWFAPRRQRDERMSDAPAVHAGERWTFTVRLKRPHGNVNPHGFDLEAWLLEHDLRATGYVRDDAGNARVAAFAGRATDYVQRARERIRTRIGNALPGAAYAGVLIALAIGDQRAIPEAQWVVFNKTGITHLVSIA